MDLFTIALKVISYPNVYCSYIYNIKNMEVTEKHIKRIELKCSTFIQWHIS